MNIITKAALPVALFCLSCAFGQVWEEVDKSFIPSFGNAKEGALIGSNLASELKKLEKDGYWRTYFNTSASGASLHPKDNPDSLLTGCGRGDNGQFWVQNYTTFTLDPALKSKDAVRISFNVDLLGRNGDANLGSIIEVLPWVVREQEIELRGAAPLAGETYQTKFLFGLVNLGTGEVYEANFSNGESHMFDYGNNTWYYMVDEDGTLNVSFVLYGDDLASVTGDGLGIVAETTWGGGSSSGAEYYGLSNLKVEALGSSAIPEPSSAALGLSGLALLMARRRKR